ncbi:MAG: cytochrome c-type biogenesis protein CcmH [Gammaproteobacteria bacterium]|nr:cytochrome c-type biogenesis protein CcmH [Gammaproteobacteria bacterium]
MRVNRLLPGAALVAVLMLMITLPGFAKEAATLAQDPVLEKRVDAVSSELRCLVCQNQTIADSHAELAIDLKNQVREMLHSGTTNEEVVNYMVERYGDFVRYKPPMKPTTYFLWFGPGLLIVIGLSVLFITLRSRRKRVLDAAPLTAEDTKKIDDLLHAGKQGTKS